MAPEEPGSSLVECVPNLSEGRDQEVISALRAAAASVDGVKLLDSHSDPDHNRTVLTFAGPQPKVSLVAMRVAREAVERIDMRIHAGVHPRMGALDVVPFVPLGGSTIEQCAGMAKEMARYLGEELGVPAFLYGAAAASGGSRSLRDIRGAGNLSVEALAKGLRRPDFGPRAPHPTAGATAVGARGPLIAFNVNLDSTDLEIAGRIARDIRASSGGLREVQALAFPLASRGLVQVSMNLLDFRVIGLARVLARVRELAAAAAVELVACQLVGLLPEAALTGLEGDTLPGIPGLEDTIEARLAQPGLS
jgi:glutamate formiminotransferase